MSEQLCSVFLFTVEPSLLRTPLRDRLLCIDVLISQVDLYTRKCPDYRGVLISECPGSTKSTVYVSLCVESLYNIKLVNCLYMYKADCIYVLTHRHTSNMATSPISLDTSRTMVKYSYSNQKITQLINYITIQLTLTL